VTLTNYPHLLSRSRMSRGYNSSPTCSLHGGSWAALLHYGVRSGLLVSCKAKLLFQLNYTELFVMNTYHLTAVILVQRLLSCATHHTWHHIFTYTGGLALFRQHYESHASQSCVRLLFVKFEQFLRFFK
jgi:hypothetical protein